MRNIQLIVAYDGTGLHGWQKTSLGPSVEEHLEKVLSQVLQEKPKLQAASRTDAGVHAEGQVVNFFTTKDLSLERLQKSFNALLPKQISILKVEEAPSSFHPTLDNQGKEYHYHVCNTLFQKPKHRLFSWQVPYSLSMDLMQQASRFFLGTHDFSSFCNQLPLLDKSAICTLEKIEIEEMEEQRIVFKIRGDRFLFRMVRNLVGTLVYVGGGKIPLSDIPSLLKNKQRAAAGITAPAHGLHLMNVFY
jgi:tRNA pseudouridine38-40 synthase